MSTSRIVFTLSDRHITTHLKERLSAIAKSKKQSWTLLNDLTTEEIKHQFDVFELQELNFQEQLAVETYKAALTEAINDKICSLSKPTQRIPEEEKLHSASPEPNAWLQSLKQLGHAFNENHPLLIKFLKWTGFTLLILLQIPFLIVLNGAGMVTGGLGLLFSLFHLALPSTPFFLVTISSLLLPSLMGTLPVFAQLLMEKFNLNSPFDSEPLIQVYLNQRKLAKSVNHQLLKHDSMFSSQDYEELIKIGSKLNTNMSDLKDKLPTPSPTLAMTGAKITMTAISFLLSVETSLSFTSLILTYGTHSAITTIAALATLNPVTFPLVFIPLLISTSTFIYLLYTLQAHQLISPATQQLDTLKKKLDKDIKKGEWNNTITFNQKLFDKRRLQSKNATSDTAPVLFCNFNRRASYS